MFVIFVLLRQLFNVQALLYDTLILREREKYKNLPWWKIQTNVTAKYILVKLSTQIYESRKTVFK